MFSLNDGLYPLSRAWCPFFGTLSLIEGMLSLIFGNRSPSTKKLPYVVGNPIFPIYLCFTTRLHIFAVRTVGLFVGLFFGVLCRYLFFCLCGFIFFRSVLMSDQWWSSCSTFVEDGTQNDKKKNSIHAILNNSLEHLSFQRWSLLRARLRKTRKSTETKKKKSPRPTAQNLLLASGLIFIYCILLPLLLLPSFPANVFLSCILHLWVASISFFY